VERDTEKRFSGERSWDPDVRYQGWRYHMSDIMAAIGKEQLKNFDYHRKRRQELAKCYATHLSAIPSISIFQHDYDNVVPHIFVILLSETANRERLIKFLGDNGVPAGVHYKPNHLLSYFSSHPGEDLPTTDILYPRLLTLPLHPQLDKKTVKHVADILKKGIEHVG
jgi:dTDP-4-amino-4,6-dideoxygalactose transaminase